ncbi:MAG TPA: alkaline phosphatase family protein [Steroidobacteraceae bacterium]|jgi:phospholipase C|nr:alkaline phosphatase family protein [Steroidobacteraceae bacterium]
MKHPAVRAASILLPIVLSSCGSGSAPSPTATPIQHVVIIIGENRSFDHVFATYVPSGQQSIWNLLSQRIVNADGTPGPNFQQALQSAASDLASDAFLLNPPKLAFPNNLLPAPMTGGPTDSFIPGDSLALAQASEPGLPAEYYPSLVSGGSGQMYGVPDARIANANALPPGPFQLTSSTFGYPSYAASPTHRFYQMWQQLDCALLHATPANPSGCDSALFSWVEVAVGIGSSGQPQPANFSIVYAPNAYTTGEGGTSMGFYNVQNGDVPYFKGLADQFAMSDNFHQSVQGGTGANHIMLGHGDMIWFSDGNGHAMTPPENMPSVTGFTAGRIVNEIENPNPQPGTNDYYAQDGYFGGSYTNCADTTQPGVAPIVNYLQSLPRPIDPHCETGHYYLLNNYNPGYFGNGNNAYTDTNPHNSGFIVPPSSIPGIGDTLLAANVSWKYYGEQWNNYLPDPYQLNYSAIGANSDEYCPVCNPFQYDTSIMTQAAVRSAHLQDTSDLYRDIQSSTLPAVSFVKPDGFVDGHPGSSKLDLFEGFVKKIVDAIQANPALWSNTAIFITFDEGGGYYDCGYVQPLDFFGDGARIPFMVVSRYAKPGYISHEYTDHVSMLKFIERNWYLPTVSSRSRDTLPAPKTDPSNPYAPTNSPALGDLFDFFAF